MIFGIKNNQVLSKKIKLTFFSECNFERGILVVIVEEYCNKLSEFF